MLCDWGGHSQNCFTCSGIKILVHCYQLWRMFIEICGTIGKQVIKGSDLSQKASLAFWGCLSLVCILMIGGDIWSSLRLQCQLVHPAHLAFRNSVKKLLRNLVKLSEGLCSSFLSIAQQICSGSWQIIHFCFWQSKHTLSVGSKTAHVLEHRSSGDSIKFREQSLSGVKMLQY